MALTYSKGEYPRFRFKCAFIAKLPYMCKLPFHIKCVRSYSNPYLILCKYVCVRNSKSLPIRLSAYCPCFVDLTLSTNGHRYILRSTFQPIAIEKIIPRINKSDFVSYWFKFAAYNLDKRMSTSVHEPLFIFSL